MQPTISISIVCSPEQLADVQARVSALQADLHRLGVAFSVSTHQEPPPRPTMTLDEAQCDPRAFVAGFVETERSVHVDPDLARRQRERLEEQGG
jgi:hypothetical protein